MADLCDGGPLRWRTAIEVPGVFIVHNQEGYLLYVWTKFEADCSIRSKVIKCPKISKVGPVTQADLQTT